MNLTTEIPHDNTDDPATGLEAVLLRTLEERLKLPPAYITSLRQEPNDWVFIVKLALLVEATLTEYLVLELRNPSLFEHISTVENASRLRLALALGLLEKRDKNLLHMLAEVRNAFVHHVANLTRPLSAYIAELRIDRQKDIAGHLLGPDGRQQLSAGNVDIAKWLPEAFRSTIFDMAVLPLISISMRHDIRERDRERGVGADFTNYKDRTHAQAQGQPAVV